jgi:hypothetical protein
MLSALIHRRTKTTTKRKPKESNFLAGFLRSTTQVQLHSSPSVSSFGSPEAFEGTSNLIKAADIVSAARSEQDATQVEQSQDQQYRSHSKEREPELESDHTGGSPQPKSSKSKHRRDSTSPKLLIRFSDEPLSKWFPVDLLARSDAPSERNNKHKTSRQSGRNRTKRGSSTSSKGKGIAVPSPVDGVKTFEIVTEVNLIYPCVLQHPGLPLAS